MSKQNDGAHAVLTGPITGRVPIDHEAFPDGVVDVTADVMYVGTQEEAVAVADAIEKEHVRRNTHPVQLAARAMKRDEPVLAEQGLSVPKALVDTHKRQLRELAERTGEEV